MVKVEAIKDFNLKDFDKLVNLQRGTKEKEAGKIYATDTFECTEEMVDYLTGNNKGNVVVVKVIEVIPEEVVEEVEEEPKEEIKEEKPVEYKAEEKKSKKNKKNKK